MRSAAEQTRGATRNDPRAVGSPGGGLVRGRQATPALDMDATDKARTDAIKALMDHGVSQETANAVCLRMRLKVAERLHKELSRMELLPIRKRLSTPTPAPGTQPLQQGTAT